MNELLKIQDLKVIFSIGAQTITAVSKANLCIGDGEVVVLAGESGSGKTVTAFSITKILPVNAKISSGRIYFSGADLLTLDEINLTKIRGAKIAYIFQEPTSYLNPVFSVGNQISEAIILHQKFKSRQASFKAKELLSLVKIKDPDRVYAEYPHQLSGGENQRVMLAMGLACKPKLLIADEPTTSLDVTVEAQILRLLMDLKKTMGFSLLFITHNLSIAQKIADRIYIMYRGEIVEEGRKEKIFHQPEHFHTKQLILAYERIGKIR